MLDLPELLAPARTVSGLISIDCGLTMDLYPLTLMPVMPSGVALGVFPLGLFSFSIRLYRALQSSGRTTPLLLFFSHRLWGAASSAPTSGTYHASALVFLTPTDRIADERPASQTANHLKVIRLPAASALTASEIADRAGPSGRARQPWASQK